MEEDEKRHANVESLAVTHLSHQQKDQIWLFAQKMGLHSGKRSPDASHLLPSTILTTGLTSIITLVACCICLH